METQQYILIESSYCVHGVRHTTYGIAYTDCSDGCAVILEAVPDLSQNKECVQHLAALCTELKLSPIHLHDVIEDFLTQ